MACPRCLRWQRHVRIQQQRVLPGSRGFNTSTTVHEETSTSTTTDLETSTNTSLTSPPQPLSILEHKSRPVRAPNDRSRPPVHAIDVSNRLGTRFSRPVIGNMEWQTSTYHYNKQTTKVYPVLANTTNKLLEAYAVLEKSKTNRAGEVVRAPKAEIAKRRKESERVFVSDATVKDYGHKIVINAFIHDAKAAGQKSVADRQAQRARPRRPARPPQAGAGVAGAAGAARRRPMTASAPWKAGRQQANSARPTGGFSKPGDRSAAPSSTGSQKLNVTPRPAGPSPTGFKKLNLTPRPTQTPKA